MRSRGRETAIKYGILPFTIWRESDKLVEAAKLRKRPGEAKNRSISYRERRQVYII